MNDLCKCVNCSHDWLYSPWWLDKAHWETQLEYEKRRNIQKTVYDYNLSVTIMKALQ